MDKALFYAVKPCEKTVEEARFHKATTVYLHVWNMDCRYCGIWLRNTLLALDEVLRVDAFVDRGMVAVTYCGDRLNLTGILAMIQTLGSETKRFYGAEIIGEEPAPAAFRSRQLS